MIKKSSVDFGKLPAHSPVGASSMERWSNCPGSIRLSKDMPNVETEYAAEGTRAHEVAEGLLEAELYGGSEFDTKGIDKEMLDAVWVYVDYCVKLVRSIENPVFAIEQTFDLFSIHYGLYGTSDFSVYDPVRKILHVVDYKHGAGIVVAAKGNKQLRYYGLGAMLALKAPVEHVQLTIVQPRANHADGTIRHDYISAMELLDFSGDLKKAVVATEAKDAPLKSGMWCRFCPAAPKCPQLQLETQALAKKTFSEASLDVQELADVLQILPRVESWIKATREFAYSQAMNGVDIPGYKLVEKRARRVWLDEKDTRSVLLEGFGLGLDQIYDMKLKTPASIERLLNKEQKNALKDHYASVSSGLTLASESDRRPPARGKANEVFGKIEDKNGGRNDR